MPENQSQPRTDGLNNPQGSPQPNDAAPEPRGADPAARPSDADAAGAPEEGRSFRSQQNGASRPDPLTAGMEGGRGRDRKLDYGNVPGIEGKGDAMRAPDDIEGRLDAAEATVRTEQNPGRDR